MQNKDHDLDFIFNKITSINSELSRKYIDKNGYFIVSNTLNFYPETISLSKLKAIQIIQKLVDEEVLRILQNIDQFGIPVIGLKGIFLKQYYGNNTRFYSDIDLFILYSNAYNLAKKLLDLGFELRPYKYPFYNKKLLMETFRSQYFNNIAHVEFVKRIPINGIEFEFCIEVHSNLNISTYAKFNHNVMFYSAKPFNNFTNIKILDEYDNILFLIYHISKHLSFAYPYATGLHIDIKMLVDIRNIIISMKNFRQQHLVQKAQYYNLIPQLILFEFLFNNIFTSCDLKFEIDKHIELLKTCKFGWKNLLIKIIKSNPFQILIGDYDDVCPGLNTYHQKLESTTNQNIRALLIHRYITKH